MMTEEGKEEQQQEEDRSIGTTHLTGGRSLDAPPVLVLPQLLQNPPQLLPLPLQLLLASPSRQLHALQAAQRRLTEREEEEDEGGGRRQGRVR